MSAPPIATAEQIKQLLELAGICSSDEEAKSWLEHALVAAQNSNRIAKKRPLWADQKELLSDIEKTARKLTRQLQQLRSHSYSFLVFWSAVEPGTAGGFARRAVLEDETSQLRHRPKPIKRLGDLEILSILSNIEGAAKTAKDPRKGRPRKDGKQYVIDQAFAFFVRQCSFAPSGTPTGRFANFARGSRRAPAEEPSANNEPSAP